MRRQEYIPHETANGTREEIDLVDYLRVIYKHRRKILLVCLLTSLVTGIVSLCLPPRYVATASVVPPLELMGGDTGLGMGLLGGAEGALLKKVMDTSSTADLYVGILESRAVTDAIIDRFDLTRVYDVGGRRYKAERKLRKYTKIKVSDEGIVYVTVEDRDPNRAAAMANAYIEHLDGQNKRLSAGQATSKRLFLENRLHEAELKLDNVENIPTREVLVQEMIYELLVRELEIAKIEEAKSMPTIQILDSAVPPEVRKARGTVRRVILAGTVALTFMIFVAFAHEYLAACRAWDRQAPGVDRDANASLPSVSGEIPMEGEAKGASGRRGPIRRRVPDAVAPAPH
jgi:uncharacterized protein involved in exopolysaccharide biosynthesis